MIESHTEMVWVTELSELEKLYQTLLRPYFPEEELLSFESFLALALSEHGRVLSLRNREGRDLAVTAAELDPESGVLLLNYLAVDGSVRAGGLGSKLLAGSLQHWQQHLNPDYVLAEVEDPAHHRGSVAYGNPEARVRFYRKFGAFRLLVPYFQPGLGAPDRRVAHLNLVVLAASDTMRVDGGESLGIEGAVLFSAEPLYRFMHSYITQSEGASPDDEQASALLMPLQQLRVAAVPL